MNFYDVFTKRHITRKFEKEEIPEEVLNRILKAGLSAPSHNHLREWEFIILKTDEEKENALKYIKESASKQTEYIKTLKLEESAEKMYKYAMPLQYLMFKEAPIVILPLFKPDPDLFKPTSISSFNSVSSIWCVIQNIFLASTYEGYACSMRIPVGDEGKNVVESIGAPNEYLLPCYIGIGKAKEGEPKVPQKDIDLEKKKHFGKW